MACIIRKYTSASLKIITLDLLVSASVTNISQHRTHFTVLLISLLIFFVSEEKKPLGTNQYILPSIFGHFLAGRLLYIRHLPEMPDLTSDPAIVEAYNDVRSDKSDTNWYLPFIN